MAEAGPRSQTDRKLVSSEGGMSLYLPAVTSCGAALRQPPFVSSSSLLFFRRIRSEEQVVSARYRFPASPFTNSLSVSGRGPALGLASSRLSFAASTTPPPMVILCK
ncbi:hypothetical protein INR49_019755 [Caranx melampygus]|nr:hypothetical protein INR49_019755 [Caranx melampygus]